jgi:uncharacterized protein (TIGR03084 family)
MRQICDDLTAEHEALDGIVGGLAAVDWDRATPAADWSIRDSLSHLWFFDQRARMALSPATVADYEADTEHLMSTLAVGVDPSVEAGRAITSGELLVAWRTDRRLLVDLARATDPSARIPWYGPAMAARSFLTARLMETWAHGQDVRDALGLAPEVSLRLKHIAHIGVRARPFAYATNHRPLPEGDVRVELDAPDGSVWTWGAEGSPDRVRGTSLDFCLVVTQRRHMADTALVAEGATAQDWLGIAQAFAGPPGQGRAAGSFQ